MDPRTLDPALGTESELRGLVRLLRRRGMGIVLDIVPNHMAADAANPYWDDVLAHGRGSAFAGWFDIDWGGPGGGGEERVFLPVLGARLPQVLARREVRLFVQDGRVRIRYYDQSFPVDPQTIAARRRSGEPLSRTARRLSHPSALRELLDAQHYRLAFWRRAAREINYRRFFTVSHLVALRVEDPAVFRASHALILRWIAEGLVDGLRIDHVDGLLDPLEYLQRLTQSIGDHHRIPVLIEKILARGERLPARWPVAGTTGYEFLNGVENLLLDPAGVAAIERFYHALTGRGASFAAVALRAKRLVLDRHLAADLWRLTRLCARALPSSRRGLGFRRLAPAVREVIVHLSVYRTYIDGRHAVSPADRERLRRAIAGARASGHADRRAVEAVASLLVSRRRLRDESRATARLDFVRRFQQLCSPVAAKGVEDTAFYRYVPLVSRNEVGADPGSPLGHASTALHRANTDQAAHWPQGLRCVSTHDTKQSADVRARLDVLSELPDLWLGHLRRWRRLNAPRRRGLDAITEYLFYQALVALWPVGTSAGRFPPRSEWSELRRRLTVYLLKAAREAKVHTSWIRPDRRYEARLDRFVQASLAPLRSRPFLRDVRRFVARVERAGLWNALARTLVHCTAPGVPDVYQGDELWNFSLVDPDNRRPVDFVARRRALGRVERQFAAGGHARQAMLHALARRPENGELKLHVVRRALQTRRRVPGLFLQGSYRVLQVTGPLRRHIFAFARRDPSGVAITVVPRLVAALGDSANEVPVGRVWLGSAIRLPFVAPWPFTEVLTGRRITPQRDSRGQYIPLDVLFRQLPGALLLATARRRKR